MAGRQSRGRQKIPMRLIESQDDLYATFSKRRRGLYNKASELSTLCGADVGIIIFSPTNNPFSFWHPTMESVIGRYRNNPNDLHQPSLTDDDHTRIIIEANTRERIEYLNRRLDEVLGEKEGIKEQEKQLNEEIDKTRGEKAWWEQIPIGDLNNEQVKEWKAWFEDLNSKVKNNIEVLRNSNGDDGPSYNVATMEGMMDPSDQFHGQYYNVPPQAHHLPFAYPPPRADQYYPSAGGGGGGGGSGSGFLQFPDLFNYFPQ